MIVITGAAGFIGSNIAAGLNARNYKDLVLVDDFSAPVKHVNFEGKTYTQLVDRDQFLSWLEQHHLLVQFVIHMGARTDTAEFDWTIFQQLNLDYSKKVWESCVDYGIPLIYASSAATYGSGELGYNDDHGVIPQLNPLNPYGKSKNEFDRWVISRKEKPFFWAGLKFFNVYGPNEYHKGRMASVIYHAFTQIQQTGAMELFRSHRKDIPDGEQSRDFIYVKDIIDVIVFLMENRPSSAIYNLGTGQARTFLDLVHATFRAMDKPPRIRFIDTPEDIRDKYQYFTEAEMDKLLKAGYSKPFTSLEKGIEEYVTDYLLEGNIA